MPELPEVETIRRQLEPRLVGRRILEAWAFDSAKFDEAALAVGSSATAVRRRGKYLLIGLVDSEAGRSEPAPPADPGSDAGAGIGSELVLHLGMTGRLSVRPTREQIADAHLRARWSLDDGTTLTFHDVRRFGRVAVVRTGCYERLPTLAALGPEPDDDAFDDEQLRRVVNGGRREVKAVLLSQRAVAGIGNIYADEALWRARVDPRSRRLTRSAALMLRDAVRQVIDEGVRHGGTTLRDYRDADGRSGTNQYHLDCYGRVGEPCRRCGTALQGGTVAARSTTWCPTCQRR